MIGKTVQKKEPALQATRTSRPAPSKKRKSPDSRSDAERLRTDPTLLADTLTIILAPALPYLLGGKKQRATRAAKKPGQVYQEWIAGLWDKIQPTVESRPAPKEAFRDAATAPEDMDARAAVRLQLRKIFEADAILAAEIARALEERVPRTTYQAAVSAVISQGRRNVAAGARRGIAAGRDIAVSGEDSALDTLRLFAKTYENL